jgi:hypothetical protein
MILAFDIKDLPGDALPVLVFLLVAFFSWLKSRFGQKEEEAQELSEEDERAREIVWRRQMGEREQRAPWQTDPTVWQPPAATPPPIRREEPPPVPTFRKPVVVHVSEKERLLAEAFEHRAGRPRRRQAATALGRALHSPGAARRGILLAEILGPPVGLRQPGERHP